MADGKVGWDALIFVPTRGKTVPRRFQRAFENFESLGELAVAVSPYYERHYHVYLGRSLKAWPEGKPLDSAKPAAPPKPPNPTNP